EKGELETKLTGFQTASKDIDNLLESQRLDKNKEGLGYSAVPPPLAQVYSPPKKDMSWTGLPEFKDDTVTDYSRPSPAIESTSNDAQNRNPSETEASPSTISPRPFIKFMKANDSPTKSKIYKVKTTKKPPVKYAEQYKKPTKKPNVRGNQRNWNNLKSYQLGPNFVMKKKACFNCGDFNHLAYDCCKWVDHRRSWAKNNNTRKSMSPRPAIHRPYRPPIRPVRPNMNVAQPKRTSFHKLAHSYNKRHFQRTSAVRSQFRDPRVATVNRKFPTVNRKLLTVNRKFPNGNTRFSTADMGNKGKAGSSQNNIDDKGYWDSGCSRHMTGNIFYVSDYEPFDGGYITGKGTIKTGKLTVETPIPTVSSPVPTACFTDSLEPSSDARLISKRVANQVVTPSLDNILTLENRFKDILGVTTNSDESNGVEADVSNMETTNTASHIPTLRIHKEHPKSQIIGHVDTPIQTRNKSKELNLRRFLMLFKTLVWVEAMQEELLQFKIQNVWTLVDCPKGCKLFPLLGKLSTVSVFIGFRLTFAGTSKYWGVLRILMISLRLIPLELETLKKEKEGLDGKLASFQTTSKDLDSLLESQRLDKNKEGLGYSDVLPPPAQIYSSPKKDLSWTVLPEFKDDTVTDYSRPAPTIESSSDDAQNIISIVTEEASPSTISPKSFIKFVKANDSLTKSKIDKAEKAKKFHVKYAEQYRKPTQKPNVRGNQRNWNNLKSHQLGPNFEMKKNACFNCGDFNHL
nr:ribonuclease H-like domain-containing protein [Tanacetum cinerariifolium]